MNATDKFVAADAHVDADARRPGVRVGATGEQQRHLDADRDDDHERDEGEPDASPDDGAGFAMVRGGHAAIVPPVRCASRWVAPIRALTGMHPQP